MNNNILISKENHLTFVVSVWTIHHLQIIKVYSCHISRQY